MAATGKLLIVFVLLAFAYVMFLGGSVLIAAAIAVGGTLLTQLIINALNPKTPQEETLQNLGFTGLNLGPAPKRESTKDQTT